MTFSSHRNGVGTLINVRWLTVLLLLLLLGPTPWQSLLAAKKIVVLYSDSTNHTTRTISGLQWTLQNSSIGCEISQVFLQQDSQTQDELVAAQKPDLLLTIGSTATAFAGENFPNLPIVFAKVLNPIESGFIKSWDSPGGHMTGSALDIPVDMQFRKFTLLIPNLKKIGVIYTDHSRRLIDEARRAAKSLGVEIVPYRIASAKELPAAVDSLCRSVQGIWTVADEELSTPQFIRYTLLETLRRGIPIMGFNQSFVESGAFLCLEADYKYVGRQAGEIALSILQGANPASIKTTVPDIVYLYLNLKTGKLLNISVSAEMITVAKETY